MSEPPPSNGGGFSGRRPSVRTHNYPGQELAFKFYNSDHVQVAVAGLIVANFIANVIEKQIDPTGKNYDSVWDVFDWFFNIIFTIELLANLYAHWFWEFWESSWNIFDTVVVTIGVINMMKLPLPDAFSLLRCMRAFRVFRLFRRIESLNRIIVAMLKAVPGVCNAFVILTIVMAIYAILGVEFFRKIGDHCEHEEDPIHHQRYITSRKMCVGEEYYGTFFRSIYTMFQVMTGESWSEAVARPIIDSYKVSFYILSTTFYYITFMLLTNFVLVNVVVAVLLDKMQANETTGLSQGELEMLQTYEKTGSSLSELIERAATIQESIKAMKTEMVTMKEEMQKVKEPKDSLVCDSAVCDVDLGYQETNGTQVAGKSQKL